MSQLGDALLTTTQQKVLGLLYAQPDRSFYTKEIIRLTGMGVATIKRELDRMVDAGILSMTRIGNQHHYQANPECPVYPELLIIVKKIFGVGRELKDGVITNDKDKLVIGGSIMVSRAALKALAQRYHIRRLVLFGSAARGELQADSDIDLLVEFDREQAPSLWAAQELQETFSGLFGDRAVDIVPPEVLRNPYRRKAIIQDVKVLYEEA